MQDVGLDRAQKLVFISRQHQSNTSQNITQSHVHHQPNTTSPPYTSEPAGHQYEAAGQQTDQTANNSHQVQSLLFHFHITKPNLIR
jgi:hypothetical protein